MTLLSIIIPAHNADRTISETLSSIVDNDLSAAEILVVDDGSTDSTAEVASAALGAAGRIVRQPALGVSVARNRGVQEAVGQYVMFVDADDVLPSGSLAAFLGLAMKENADITIGDFQMRGESSHRVSAVNSGRRHYDENDADTFQSLVLARVGFGGVKNVGLLGAPWAKLYRRAFLLEYFEGVPFTPDVPRGQDVLFNLEAFGLAKSVAYHPDVVYRYTVSTSSSSHREDARYPVYVQVLVSGIERVLERRSWGHLHSKLDRMTLVLLDEAVRRSDGSGKEAKRLARTAPFAGAVARGRLRDASLGGKIKLACLKIGAFSLYARLTRPR